MVKLTLAAVGPDSVGADLDQQSVVALNQVFDHMNSAIACRDLSAVTAIVKDGADSNGEHVFVPFSTGIDSNRMICVGFREVPHADRILEIALVNTQSFRAHVISLPLLYEPKNRDPQYYQYIGELIDHHLQETHPRPLPTTPVKYRQLEGIFQNWIHRLKSLFRQAVLEFSSGLNLDRTPNSFHFVISPDVDHPFRFGSSIDATLNSVGVSPKLAEKAEDGKVPSTKMEVETETALTVSKCSTPMGLRCNFKRGHQQLIIDYPNFLSRQPGFDRCVTNWQKVWFESIEQRRVL